MIHNCGGDPDIGYFEVIDNPDRSHNSGRVFTHVETVSLNGIRRIDMASYPTYAAAKFSLQKNYWGMMLEPE